MNAKITLIIQAKNLSYANTIFSKIKANNDNFMSSNNSSISSKHMCKLYKAKKMNLRSQ